jgi:hypothetical protein
MQKQLLTARQFVYTSYVETKSEGKYVMNMTEFKIFWFLKDSMKKNTFWSKKTSQKLHFQKNFKCLIFSQS